MPVIASQFVDRWCYTAAYLRQQECQGPEGREATTDVNEVFGHD